jgi:hypothetical protein
MEEGAQIFDIAIACCTSQRNQKRPLCSPLLLAHLQALLVGKMWWE